MSGSYTETLCTIVGRVSVPIISYETDSSSSFAVSFREIKIKDRLPWFVSQANFAFALRLDWLVPPLLSSTAEPKHHNPARTELDSRATDDPLFPLLFSCVPSFHHHLPNKRNRTKKKKLDSSQSKTMRYIGVSRGIQQTLRLNLTRRPKETYYFKVCCVLLGVV